jgi:hypothetical protein
MTSFGRDVNPEASVKFSACEESLASMNKNTSQGHFNYLLRPFLLLYYQMILLVRLTKQEFSPVDIIPPCFSVLIYHLEDKQQARFLPQFRDAF